MILAMILISFFLVSFNLFSHIKDRKSIQRRVDTMNSFVFAVEEDMERRVFISGFRAIFLFEDYITQTGLPITNLDSSFEEIFYNGTLYGEQKILMQEARFDDIEDLLREKANKIGANLSMSNPEINITQEDPWNVKVSLETDFLLEDEGELVSWNKTLIAIALIPIENFGDPLYYINTNSLVFGNISKTPFTDFVEGGDVSNLLAHLEGNYYLASPDGPSFLDRLKGINAPNVNGIESLVNLDELVSRGISVEEKSIIDYEYFSANNPAFCSIQESGMPSWFRLNTERVGDYEVGCA